MWLYNKTDFEGMNKYLESALGIDDMSMGESGDVEAIWRKFRESIFEAAAKFVPSKLVRITKSFPC